MRVDGRRLSRFLPVTAVAVAAIVLAIGCAGPEPLPEEHSTGSRAKAPGGTIPPPDAPAELARPVPVPAPPEAGLGESRPEAEIPAPEPVVEMPAGLPAAVSPPAGAGAENAVTPPVAGRTHKEPDHAAADRKPARKNAGKQVSAAASGLPRGSAAQEIPVWARENEELSYKITFMGVTAGYARFLSKGKVRIGGRDAYHILVKAWTTGTLAVLFPISESFDYYLDAETLAPLRRDSWIRKVNRPEIVLFDQENGTVTHWYADTMEVRKKKQVRPPTFYEGVSATYFFRTRGFGDRTASIRVFGGRKVYRVSSERTGEEETIPYGNGKVDTFLVKPVYKEEGGSGEKPMLGELVVWVSNDARRVPVKLFAAFRKGLEWRLVGELQAGLPAS
jgi:hypothetical protein